MCCVYFHTEVVNIAQNFFFFLLRLLSIFWRRKWLIRNSQIQLCDFQRRRARHFSIIYTPQTGIAKKSNFAQASQIELVYQQIISIWGILMEMLNEMITMESQWITSGANWIAQWRDMKLVVDIIMREIKYRKATIMWFKSQESSPKWV